MPSETGRAGALLRASSAGLEMGGIIGVPKFGTAGIAPELGVGVGVGEIGIAGGGTSPPKLGAVGIVAGTTGGGVRAVVGNGGVVFAAAAFPPEVFMTLS